MAIIEVNGLGKKYYLGERMSQRSILDSLKTTAKMPYRLARTLFTGTTHKREEFWALKDVSFKVEEGEVLGIIGRNGAGKSTLLKILSRIVAPTEGEVVLSGRVGSLLEVGTGFHPELTGRENIFMNGSLLGMSHAEITKHFDEIVDFSGIEKFLDTPVKFYSSGMYTRLAFSVAAHLRTEILIVDEVLAVGDTEFQKKCLAKMDSVSKSGRTILFVSHNMTAVEQLCSEVLLLKEGHLTLQTDTKAGIKEYLKLDISNNYDLTCLEQRSGIGDIRFTKLELSNPTGYTSGQLTSGTTVDILLHFKIQNPEKTYKNARASILISNLYGQSLLLFSSEIVNPDKITIDGNGYLKCTIPKFPLSRGKYYMTLFLEADNNVQDNISNQISLDVIDGDFYGTGQNYPAGWEGKTVMIDHHWSLHNNE
jgi:homopolymeric O-antigen transport system ATP-binding protein